MGLDGVGDGFRGVRQKLEAFAAVKTRLKTFGNFGDPPCCALDGFGKLRRMRRAQHDHRPRPAFLLSLSGGKPDRRVRIDEPASVFEQPAHRRGGFIPADTVSGKALAHRGKCGGRNLECAVLAQTRHRLDHEA